MYGVREAQFLRCFDMAQRSREPAGRALLQDPRTDGGERWALSSPPSKFMDRGKGKQLRQCNGHDECDDQNKNSKSFK